MPQDSTTNVRARDLILLATAVFGAALLIRLVCFTGLIASDDMSYVGYARRIAEGTYQVQPNHHGVRYGVIVPVAVLYRLFGPHEWTTVLWPLVCSSAAAMLTAVVAAQLSGLAAGWAAGALMATFPIDIRYATVLVPEPIVQAMVLSGVLFFLFAERKQSMLLGVVAGFCLGLSYLTKEAGALFAIAFVLFALLRRQWQLAGSVAVGASVVVAGEFAWYWSQSRDVSYRVEAMVRHNAAMGVQSPEYLSYRLVRRYPKMMLVPGIHLGLHSLFALGVAALGFLGRRFSKEVLMLVCWAAVPLLYLNFGTSSLDRFVALPAAHRYVSIVYPPLFILAAITLTRWAAGRAGRLALIWTVIGVICIVGVFSAHATAGTGFRTDHVSRLRQIADTTRTDGSRICEFKGEDANRWQAILEILAPESIGCVGSHLLRLEPDSEGLPVIALH